MSNSTFDLEPEVSHMSSVRFLESTAPVARAIQRKQLAVEIGANSPRFDFGVKFAIPAGYSVDPRHPAPPQSIAKTTFVQPGPGHYEVVDPAVTKMPSTPKASWGNRGVWADVDHVELTKQMRDSYGRYMTADGRRSLAEMSMSRAQSRAVSRASLPGRAAGSPFGLSREASAASGLSGERSDGIVFFGASGEGGGLGGARGAGGVRGGGQGLPSRGASRMSNNNSCVSASRSAGRLFTDPAQLATLAAAAVIGGAEGASGLDDGDGGKRRTVAGEKTKRHASAPGETVYNLPSLNHGPPDVFAPTCSAYANRVFVECLTPSKRFVATPKMKHRPLADFPDPRMRQQYVKTSPKVRADTITETMRRRQRTIQFRVPDVGSEEDKKGPSKVYREVILKPYRKGPIKRDYLQA